MKNLLVVLSVILLIGCGDERDQPVKEDKIVAEYPGLERYDTSAKLVQSTDDILCDNTSDGTLVYVITEGIFRYCDAGTKEWIAIDLSGKDGVDGQDFTPLEVVSIRTETRCDLETDTTLIRESLPASDLTRFQISYVATRHDDMMYVDLQIAVDQGPTYSASQQWHISQTEFVTMESDILKFDITRKDPEDYSYDWWQVKLDTDTGIYKIGYHDNIDGDFGWDFPAANCSTTDLTL